MLFFDCSYNLIHRSKFLNVFALWKDVLQLLVDARLFCFPAKNVPNKVTVDTKN